LFIEPRTANPPKSKKEERIAILIHPDKASMRAPIPFLQISGGLLITTSTTTSLTAFSLDSGTEVWNFEIAPAPTPENQPQAKKRKISETESSEAPKVEEAKAPLEAAPAAEPAADATPAAPAGKKAEPRNRKFVREDQIRQVSSIHSCDAEDGTGYIAVGMTDKRFVVLAVKEGQSEPQVIYTM
jgi:hypothetical protein